jgi:hypothetical protein
LQLWCHTTPINLMHNQLYHKAKIQNKRQGVLIECTGACLDPKQCYYPHHLMLVDHHTPLDLLHLNFRLKNPSLTCFHVKCYGLENHFLFSVMCHEQPKSMRHLSSKPSSSPYKGQEEVNGLVLGSVR